jgi:hypothetical protein
MLLLVDIYSVKNASTIGGLNNYMKKKDLKKKNLKEKKTG